MCRELARGYTWIQWTLGAAKSVTMDQLWYWVKLDGCDNDGATMTGAEQCA